MFVRDLFLKVWNLVDPIYCSFTRLQLIIPNRKEDAVFRVRLTKYKGNDVILSDGTKINKNDLMLKIHLYNVRLLRDYSHYKNELTKGIEVFRRTKDSMPYLAEYIQSHPKETVIKGIIGITMINKGFRTLGFECTHPKSKIYSLYKKITHIPIYLLSHSRFSSAKLKKHHTVYLMMSKGKLYNLYKP